MEQSIVSAGSDRVFTSPRGQTEFQVNLKIGLTAYPVDPIPRGPHTPCDPIPRGPHTP